MSVHLIDAVFRADLPATRKLILLALADNANDTGFCWPNQETIAIKASISVRNLRTHLHALEADGWMTVVSLGNGRGRSTEYLLNVEKIKAAKADDGAQKADDGAQKADRAIRPTVIQPSDQPSTSSKWAATPDFVEQMRRTHPLLDVEATIRRALAHPAHDRVRNDQRYLREWLSRDSRTAEWRKSQALSKGGGPPKSNHFTAADFADIPGVVIIGDPE